MPAGGLPYPADTALTARAAPEPNQPAEARIDAVAAAQPTRANQPSLQTIQALQEIIAKLEAKEGLQPGTILPLIMRNNANQSDKGSALPEVGPLEVSQQAGQDAGLAEQVMQILNRVGSAATFSGIPPAFGDAAREINRRNQ